MKISILISKKEGIKVCPDDYKIGWLYQDDKEAYWSVWGSCKDFKAALKCARDTINKKGEKEVYLSSILLDKHLTLEQMLNLENITESFK